MIERFFFACLIFSLLICPTGLVAAADFNESMEEADAYLRNGQYLEAVGAYREMSERASNPEIKSKAILRIGDIYSYFLNNPDRAIDQYDLVIRQYAASPHTAYFNSGMILYEKNRYAEALARFRAYLEKFPQGDRRTTAEFMAETCSKPPPPAPEKKKETVKSLINENVRVLILTSPSGVNIGSSALLEVRSGDEKNVIVRIENAVVDMHQRNIRLNGSRLSLDQLVIVPSEGGMLTLNGHSFRGKFRIQKSQKGLDIINVLDVESYLYGVVPKEMSPQWSYEALKAQAVSSRSYALYQMEKSRNRDYDVFSTTASQVYGGMEAETERSSRAVDETRGMAIRYNGQPVLAYFHANSGGMTEDAEQVWTAEIPYLKSVRDDYSVKTPASEWKLSLNIENIRKALNEKGVDIGSIEDMSTAEVSPSGRVMKIRISHNGRETVMRGNDFRIKMDPTVIKSTLFTMTRQGREVCFEGKGYGHGVGMSQWGAYIMAREGRSYRDILQYYYQGVEIATP